MTSYKVYRNGGGPVESRIKTACQLFYRDRGTIPAGVVVNPTELQAARAACAALSLGVPVEAVGGCLIPEVWLQEPDAGRKEVHQLSLDL